MAEILSRESITPVGTAIVETAPVEASPVQALAESSVISYTKPATIAPLASPLISATKPASITTSEPIAAKPLAPILETRPIQINNLMIDPSLGTATKLNPSSGGGGGGMFAPAEKSTTGAPKKSWLPVILILIGSGFIVAKLLKKKAA
jgi:hypothetical protein